MTKKVKKIVKSKNRKTAMIVLGAVSFALVGYVILARVRLYNQTADLAATVSIRQLILQAVEGLKTDAPIDPKTGDTYFPQAKLYLPNSASSTKLTYAYDASAVHGEELSVSNRSVFNQNAVNLYAAKNVPEVMAAVPKLQACSRGVKLMYNKIVAENQENELKATVKLSNGNDLFIYVEKACPELHETAELLKNVQAY